MGIRDRRDMDSLNQSRQERQRGECYQKIRKLTERLGPMREFGRNIFTKNPEPVKRGKVFEYDHEPGELAIAMQELLDRREVAMQPQLAVFEDIVRREPYSVEEKATEIVRRVKLAGITRFLLLFKGSRSRSELVATFMAVLELCRSRIIRLASGVNDCTVECASEMPDDWKEEV